jgi:HEAT repeat protein
VGAPGIAELLPSATDEGVKRELVRMLSNSHDPRAAEPLAGQLASADEEIKQLAAFGLAELGDARALPVLLTLAQGDDLTVGREALSKIQHLGSEQAVDGLLTMLADERFLGRKANILRALGTSGAAHAGPAIERELEGDDVASAAAALADLNYEPSYRRLLGMIPRPRDTDFSTPSVANETAFMNRTAAVRAIGRYGRPDAIEALITIVEDPLDDRWLRQDAGMALGAVATDEALTTVVAKLGDPELDEVAKRYYLAALWQRPSRALSSALLDLVASPDTPPDVKMSMALAIGYAADPAADERIGAMLADPALVERAAFAVILGGSDANARALVALLPNNGPLNEAILFAVRDDETNAFNLITNAAFESGEIWRRLSVASILNEGDGDNRYGFVWNHLIGRLRAGWDGHDGLTPRQIREKLWEALRGEDPARRVLVTRVLSTMDERGLLMASRDQAGAGSNEARDELRRINTVAQEQ